MSGRFLVIGSNSFSGAQYIKHLLAKKHEVLAVSRSEEAHHVFLPYRWQGEPQGFIFKQVDLNTQLDDLMRHIHEFQPEYVVNFAAQGMVAQSWQTPEHWYQTNVVAQVKLHNQLRTFSCINKYIHITTPEVYGSTEGWVKENFHFNPSTPYAVSRAACDLHLMSFFKAYQFPVIFTRAANVYGPGQQLYRIIPRAMLFARTGRKLSLHGGGHSVRSFIHIDDVSDAITRAALHETPGETYHLSTKEVISIRQLVERICALMQVEFSSLAEVSEDRLGKDQAYLLDSGKARTELGWKDCVSLEAGLKETLAWVDNNLKTLTSLPSDYIHKA